MRSPSIVLALLLSTPMALAQADAAPAPGPQDADMAPPPGAPMEPLPTAKPLSEGWKANETDAAAVSKGQAAIAGLVKAYTEPAAIEDKVTMVLRLPGNEQTQEMTVAFGPKGAVRMSAPGVTITRLGDDLYLEPGDVPGKYFKATKAGSLSEALAAGLGSDQQPMPQVRLRGGKAEEAPAIVGSMFVANPKVAGFRSGGGSSADIVMLKGDAGGEIEVSIAPKGGRLAGVSYLAAPPGAPAGFRLPIDLRIESAAFDTDLPVPIAFDAKGRKEVDSLDKLQMTLDAGSVAPDFKLKDTDGNEVTLASLKGSVVVIDFWATWCGPCMKGLPKVEEFAKWAKESGKAVKVFGINTMEESEGPDDLKAKIADFWKKKGFTFPTLLDGENEASKAYGVQGIPFTVVIDPQGKVADVHMGLVPTLVDDLKKATEAALAAPAPKG